MSRGERFTLGTAVMSAALSVILKKETIAWVVFILSAVFLVIPSLYAMGVILVFGAKRPNSAAIERMGSVEYEPLLHDPRSRRWIQLVDWWNGY